MNAERPAGEAADTRVIFVCWGNICRSPMAELVARAMAENEGIAAEFTSAGVSDEERGNPTDPRAVRTLEAHGYPTDRAVAHRITAGEIEQADLVIAMERSHLDRLVRIAGGVTPGGVTRGDERLRLLTDFDPDATPGSGVPDPWYGAEEGFVDTLTAVEAAMPGVLSAVREIAEGRLPTEQG